MPKRVLMLATLMILALGGYGVVRFVGPANSREVKGASVDQPQAMPVVTALAEVRSFEDSVKVQGTLRAKNFALVSPRSDGMLEEIAVSEGDPVEAGKTLLFRGDTTNLEKRVQMARQDLLAARFAREQQAASVRKTDVELRRAKSDFDRFEALYREQAVSQSVYEDKQAVYDQLQSMRQLVQSGLAMAREAERKAEASLAMAEKDLQDAYMYAPISGVVTKRMAEPGEVGSRGKPILRIDDVGTVEAVAYLPGQFYGDVREGRTSVRLGEEERWERVAPVTYKSSVVDPTLRTFEIRTVLSGDGEHVVPGVLVNMRVVRTERRGVGVPYEALLERNSGKVIFLTDGQTAREVSVTPGLETGGWVEIVRGEVASGDAVVVQGQSRLSDGSMVTVRNRETKLLSPDSAGER
ncbi:MAG TPA: efflux RND transporter periplasmic adaptor subunit [Synergistaceae bacterium]|nr:efflux RND transporter periplasmic adaptor subunit [Synergistaceae bacterium]